MRKSPPTRRDFMKATAASTAGVLLGTLKQDEAKAQEPEKKPEPPKDFPEDSKDLVRLAIIGTGGMGTGHANSFASFFRDKIDHVKVTALCDVAQPRLADAIKSVSKIQGSEPKGYDDHRKLLESKDVDGVVIASPEHWHAPMAIDALDAGKDVYVEKPMTLRLEEALRLYKAAWSRKERIMVGTQYVTYQKYHDARKLIQEGAIGHPTFSQTSYCRNSEAGEWLYYDIDKRVIPGETLDWKRWCGPLGPAAWDPEVYFRWRRYRRYSTGIIGDLLVHKMTPLIMAIDAGWPVAVSATGGHYVDKAMDNHDQVNLNVQFERDHTMVVAGSTCNEFGFEEVIRGHRGNLFTAGGRMVLRPERIYAEEVDVLDKQYEGSDPHVSIRRNFLSSIRTRKQPISTIELATKVMVIVDLATRSLWEGKTYRFDPNTLTARPA